MPDPIRVAVIVAAWNAARWLDQTIGSVKAQRGVEWELILIDDGSEDETRRLCDHHAKADPRIRIATQPHGGSAVARNHGARLVSPGIPYLFFLDADDWLHPDALATLAAELEVHPEAGMVSCGFYDVDEPGRVRAGPRTRTRHVCSGWGRRVMRDDERVTPFEAFFFATANGPMFLHRRAVFERTQGWSEDFWAHNDTDLLIQMALQAEAHLIPTPLYFKRSVAGSLMRGKGRGEYYRRLRLKWDHYRADDPGGQAMIDAARQSYYRRYRPIRAAWCALKHLRVWLGKPGGAEWKQVWFLAGLSVHDLWRYTLLRQRERSDGRGYLIR